MILIEKSIQRDYTIQLVIEVSEVKYNPIMMQQKLRRESGDYICCSEGQHAA
jgi:hypothetical protein